MQVKFLLTPSRLIDGLPDPIPREGDTVELVNSLAIDLIHRNIAVPVETPKRKVRAVAPKPSIAETKTDDKKKDKD